MCVRGRFSSGDGGSARLGQMVAVCRLMVIAGKSALLAVVTALKRSVLYRGWKTLRERHREEQSRNPLLLFPVR